MVGKKVISAAPAPGDKRYTLYSLPNCQAEFLSAKAPPPPPPPSSLPIAIYESENHIEQGFQIDSKINSRYIAIDSTVTVESEILSTANDCENWVSEIDSFYPLSQGEGEVKCVSVCNEAQPEAQPFEQVSIAPPELETAPTAPTAQPITPSDLKPKSEQAISDADAETIRKLSAQEPTSTLSAGSSQSKLLLLQEYAERIMAAIGFQSPAVGRAISRDIQKSIAAGEFSSAELAEFVGVEIYQAFTVLRLPNEEEEELVKFVRVAIASNDAETAKSVLSSLKEVCNSGACRSSESLEQLGRIRTGSVQSAGSIGCGSRRSISYQSPAAASAIERELSEA
jgi:hypothetical protein